MEGSQKAIVEVVNRTHESNDEKVKKHYYKVHHS